MIQNLRPSQAIESISAHSAIILSSYNSIHTPPKANLKYELLTSAYFFKIS